MSKAREAAVAYRSEVGFWLYLMTDCLLFGSLFATYAVLRGATAEGPTEAEIFEMPFVLAETFVLLTSSLTAGMMLLAAKLKNVRWTILWMALTYILGVIFLTIELHEFSTLIAEGHSWQQSAFLSSFFALVGTHGLHIAFGLLWLIVLAVVLLRRGFSDKLQRQLTSFGMFWHFLDLVWIFIFTVVYLLGVAG